MHEQYFTLAGTIATEATCRQAHCGSVIVAKDKTLIGRGYNAPPFGDESQRRCAATYHPDKIVGSTLYFMRVDSDGEFTQAGQSYGTVWSRLALQSSIKTFGLWNDDPQMIDIKQYNVLSYDYFA